MLGALSGGGRYFGAGKPRSRSEQIVSAAFLLGSVGGCHSEPTNPTLEALLAVIDEVEKLTQMHNHLRRC